MTIWFIFKSQQMMTTCSSADPKKNIAQSSFYFRFDDVNRSTSDPSYTGINLRCDVSEYVRVQIKLKRIRQHYSERV